MADQLDEVCPLITVELTSSEQISLLGLIMQSTNGIIASGDKFNWLSDLERIEEKIRDQQDDLDSSKGIIMDYRGA